MVTNGGDRAGWRCVHFTILIAVAGAHQGLTPDEQADHVATGALRALPAAVVLRATAEALEARLAAADLVLTAGASPLTARVGRSAMERGTSVVALGGALCAAGRERYAVGIAAFEPDGHPDAIDTGLAGARLRQAAASAVRMSLACDAAAA
jgi:hypothetical protein